MHTPLRRFVLVSALVHGLAGLVLTAALPQVSQLPPAGAEPLHVELNGVAASAMRSSREPRTRDGVVAASLPWQQSQHKIARNLTMPQAPVVSDPADATTSADSPEPSESVTGGPVTAHQPQSAIAETSLSPSQDGGLPTSSRQQIQNRLAALLEHYFHYPWIARLRGWQGDVRLAFRVAPDGEIQHIHVERSSGFAVLDKSALDSLTRVARLSDATEWLNGQPLDMQLAIVYRLKD